MSLFRVILVRMRENSDQNNSKYGHFLRSENVVNTSKKQCIFLMIKFLLLACIFHIILLSKQFFCKNNFGFGFLKSLCRTYVSSDIRFTSHRTSWQKSKNVYFKAWLCTPNAKAEYTGLYACSNGFTEACVY